MCRHDHILSLIDFFWDEKRVYVVLNGEVEKDVYSKLLDCKRFDERRAVRYLRQVMSVVQYCHGMHIVHRDIKPENLVLTADVGIGILTFR